MQTEEVVPCAQSTSLDGSSSDRAAPFQQQQHQQLQPLCTFAQQLQYPIPVFLNMAVKQEPQEEDDRARQANALSPQTEIEDAQAAPDASFVHKRLPEQPAPQFEAGPGPLAPQENGSKKPASRGRRKSRWKLKFHHQALPPEYLDHYEAALAQEAAQSSSTPSPVPPGPVVGDVQGWLQRLAAMQTEIQASPQPAVAAAARRSVITSTQPAPPPQPPPPAPSQGRPPMKYSDLPYMGEITLDNSKPRRGRKPKKADICHLIYKNYGTILPGTPGLEDGPKLAAQPDKLEPRESFQRSDIQNRISSLLEKRLTQERRALEADGCGREQDEPLNLCIRDLNLLKIRLNDKHSFRPYRSRSEGSSDAEDVDGLAAAARSPTEPEQPAETAPRGNNGFFENGQPNGRLAQPEAQQQQQPGLLYWPNAGVFVHPAALQSQFLYYQKLAQEKGLPGPAEQCPPAPRPKRNSAGQQAPGQPLKRKRSAIFIPPMPTENNNNPATEVSICKFKFTGGAKPSLQEKKSLSVDSGGNFRYYSGTGDKSMRGYEFFPREALQQQQQQQQPAGGSSAAGFLGATAEQREQQRPAQQAPVPATVVSRPPCQQDDSRRKRKTRKSLQREKLEQTFKEKGFLIQTQQLESAEGATYCKFRQLRKFTRYLFRSWKDYLPGNVRELTDGQEPLAALKDIEQEPDQGPIELRPSPPPGAARLSPN